MARFIDKIIAYPERWSAPAYIERDPMAMMRWRQQQSAVLPVLQTSQVFVVDNVARYFFEAPNMCKTWDLTKDFPNIAPPYPSMWMEHQPARIIRETEGLKEDERYTRDPAKLAELDKRPQVLVKVTGQAWCGVLVTSKHRLPDDPEFARYGAWSSLYQFFKGWDDRKEINAAMGGFYLDVNPDGTFKDIRPVGYTGNVGEPDDKMFHQLEVASIPFLLALCFTHCGNVTVKTEAPPKALSKKFEKKTNRKLITYKTLEIEPMKRILQHEGQAGTRGIQYALHQCRGYFAHYGDKFGKGKLFGKYEALVWHEPTIRGKDLSRVVEKEYDVQSVREDEMKDGEQEK